MSQSCRTPNPVVARRPHTATSRSAVGEVSRLLTDPLPADNARTGVFGNQRCYPDPEGWASRAGRPLEAPDLPPRRGDHTPRWSCEHTTKVSVPQDALLSPRAGLLSGAETGPTHSEQAGGLSLLLRGSRAPCSTANPGQQSRSPVPTCHPVQLGSTVIQ